MAHSIGDLALDPLQRFPAQSHFEINARVLQGSGRLPSLYFLVYLPILPKPAFLAECASHEGIRGGARIMIAVKRSTECLGKLKKNLANRHGD
jgi:hypothetical protein